MTTSHPVRSPRGRLRTVRAVVLAAGLALAGCTGPSTATSAMDGAPEQFAAAASSAAGGAEAPRDSAAAADAPQGDQGAAAGVAAAQRSIVRTADLRVRLDVPEPAEAADADDPAAVREQSRRSALTAAQASARATAGGAGGFVASASGDDSRADLTMRVPTATFDQVRDALSQLGTVTASTESSADVTAELVDGQSRVDTMTASVTRVRQLLTQAEAIGDVLAIESELTAREAELESWQRQVAAKGDQVDLATITVGISAVSVGVTATVVAEPSRNAFVTGLADGWDAFTGLFTAVAAVLGALLPFLPVLLVLGGLTWWLLRRRAGRTGRAPRPAPAPATE